MYVAAFDVPLTVVSVTFTAPAAPAGAVTVSDVALAAVTVAAFEPKSTVLPAVVVANPVPVMVTVLPPVVRPLVGLIDVIAGGGVTYVYVAAFDVPPEVVSVTLTEPTAWAGAVTVSDVALAAVTVALVPPNDTALPPVVVAKPVPVMVTVVPPAIVPLVGLIDVIAGTGGGAT